MKINKSFEERKRERERERERGREERKGRNRRIKKIGVWMNGSNEKGK